MADNIMLSNGDLTAELDSYGQVAALRYPNHSSNNHVGDGTLRHKIGLYSENAVHWLDDGAWKVQQAYYPGRLISRTIANNLWLDVRLEIQDYVDSELDILIRNIHVINLSGRERHAKLFLHQSFVIDNNVRNIDTAQYLPAGVMSGLDAPSITHYHGDKAFVISGQCCNSDDGFTEFSIGHFGKYNNQYMSGVWCDAADGTLSGNTHEQGHTDSIIGFDVTLKPHDSVYVNYYLSAGTSTAAAAHNLQKLLHEGVDARTKKTAEHWLEWLQPAIPTIKSVFPPESRYRVIDCLVQLRGNMGNNGAVTCNAPAATGSGTVTTPLVNPTTAAAAAVVLTRLGLDIDAARIFDFFTQIATPDHGLLPYYTADGCAGPNPHAYIYDDDITVLPIDITDTASLLLSLCRAIDLVTTTRTIPADWRKRWSKLGAPLADFLSDYIDPISKLPVASYHGDHGPESTMADAGLVYVALMSAAHISERVKDTDSVIKYQTVADDIRDNVDELWGDAMDKDDASSAVAATANASGSNLLRQLLRINGYLETKQTAGTESGASNEL